jgi:S-adenosylmethionine:tRNA ribosyltransferase-isomerase
VKDNYRRHTKVQYQHISVKDYSYNLPTERIAKYPLDKRDESRLLIYKERRIKEDIFKNIHQYINCGSCLVFNNTQVIQARILFRKPTGARIEIFCLEPEEPGNYVLAFQQKQKVTWRCIIGNQKKWKSDYLQRSFRFDGNEYVLKAIKKSTSVDSSLIEFKWNAPQLLFGEVLESVGITPIPPYLKRAALPLDKDRYQTIYSRHKGSVAAPTAGFHFTDNVINNLSGKNIKKVKLTLHVGIGTFRPIKSGKVTDHKMHTEQFYIKKAGIKCILENTGHIITVGTTSMRALESLYWLGAKINQGLIKEPEKIFISQWDGFNLSDDLSTTESLKIVLDFMEDKKIERLHASTRIMLVPGYSFKLVNGLITNFHMPRSSLLLLVAAFIGEDWRKVYDYALNNNFRLLSYGDSSIIFRD